MNSRTKLLHLPGPDEASLDRHEWTVRYGWPNGLSFVPSACVARCPILIEDMSQVVPLRRHRQGRRAQGGEWERGPTEKLLRQ